MIRPYITYILFLLAIASTVHAQGPYSPVELDLTADIASPRLESSLHRPLPEQYIWGGSKNPGRSPILYFRKTFVLKTAPRAATLYAAGPDHIEVFVNGKMAANAAGDPTAKIHPLVLSVDATRALVPGSNSLAFKVSGGDRLVVKIVPAGPQVMAAPIVMSGPDWKYDSSGEQGWEQPGYNDSAWATAKTLGAIENDIEDFQWNRDEGLYRWPGYDGLSPFLAHLSLKAEAVNSGFEGGGKFANASALLESSPELRTPATAQEFSVTLPAGNAPRVEDPYIVLDFGRESDGRLEVISDSAAPMKLEVQYGESLEEALHEPWLGVDELEVPPHATVHGPKSAFRYVLVRFVSGASPLRFKAIRLDATYYPVHTLGAFESSDALLNRIWEVGAYTSHLCMQDGIWDAPKRDRGRWMGDLDVSGSVIDTVFADRFLMQETLNALVHAAGSPVHNEVNGIPGYSAFWVMGQADFYRHLGDAEYLHTIHDPLVQLLDFMEADLDGQNLFANLHNLWPFIDWSPDMNGDTAETRRATQLEYYKAFSEGAWLLDEMGDKTSADKFRAKAAGLKRAAYLHLLDSSTNTFGPRWQTNAMAILSGVADAAITQSIWQKVLSQPRHFMITPYYNMYVICAMAKSGHRQEALDWIREYWGGMVKEGATSFWEAYDPTWRKENFHRSLQADNGQGYFVSLSHGWSSGPTAWLTEQVLGIQPQAAGFSKTSIRPDLVGLQWARGAEPTPHGLIKVDYRAAGDFEGSIELPDGVDAEVSLPVSQGETSVQINGTQTSGTPAEDGRRVVIRLNHPGTYKLRAQ